MPTRTVQLQVGANGPSGIAALTEGASVSFTLSDRLKVGTTLVVPESLVAAAGDSVELEVTPEGWAYKVEIWTRKERHRPLWVVVPEGGPVALVDLTVVDPKTLQAIPPEPAWSAAVAGKVSTPTLGGGDVEARGCSYVWDGLAASVGLPDGIPGMYVRRFGERYGAGDVTSYAVPGTRVNHLLGSLLSAGTWPGLPAPVAGAVWPGAAAGAPVLVFDTMTNDAAHFVATSYPVAISGAGGDRYLAAMEALTEAALAVASSASRLELQSDASGVTFGGTWANTSQDAPYLSGGKFASTQTPGAYVERSVMPPQEGPNAGRVHIGVAQFDPGVLPNAAATVAVDGGAPKAWAAPGWEGYPGDGGSVTTAYAMIAVDLPVDGAAHTVRLTHAGSAGQWLCPDVVLVGSETPPDIYVMEAPKPVVNATWWTQAQVDVWAANAALISPRVRAAVARFANAVWVPTSIGAEGLWTGDGIHLGDLGQRKRAGDLGGVFETRQILGRGAARMASSVVAGSADATDAAASAKASASSASSSAATASSAASSASTDRGAAETARAGAETAQSGAQTARTGAEAARDQAQATTWSNPVALFSTDDLNTKVTSGLFVSNSNTVPNVSRNWPNLGSQCLAFLRVVRRGSDLVHQTVEVATGGAAAVGRTWRRTGTSSDGGTTWSWSSWRVDGVRAVTPASGPGVELYASDDLNNVERLLVTQNNSLGSADLNTVLNPGIYNQTNGGNATLAANYPKAGVAGVLTVKLWNGGMPVQVYEPYPTVSGGPNRHVGHWERSFRGTTWSPWVFLAAQRIDKTAGLAIYTADEQGDREQLIYGDTGWRAITTWDAAGAVTGQALSASWGPMSASSGGIWVRRQTYGVAVAIRNLRRIDTTTANVWDTFGLPVGLRSSYEQGMVYLGPNPGTIIFNGGALTRGFGDSAGANGSIMNIQFNALTTDPWPTSLPGTAVGTIPNL